MRNKVYVGNLPFSASEDEIKQHFSQCGEIVEFNLIVDKETGRKKGFGFITYVDQQSAEKAIKMNGSAYEGRNIKVNLAQDKREGGRGGNGGGRGGRW